MSTNNIIKYEIQKSRSIVGQGSIDNIKNKHINKIFQLYSDQDHSFDVDLRFQAPSIVTEINLRFINTESYEITLIDTKNKVLQEIKKKNINKDSETVVVPKTVQPVRYARIKIIKNPYASQQLGIRYIIFMGINDEVQKKPTSKIKTDDLKGNLKIDNFYPVETKINLRNDHRKTESKLLFNEREKSKGIKELVQNLVDFSQFHNYNSSKKDNNNQSLEKSQNKPRKKVKRNQDQQNFLQLSRKSYQRYKRQKQQQKEQTQLAIALSKSVEPTYEDNYEKMQIEKNQIEDSNELPAELQNYVNEKIYKMDVEEPEGTYRTVDFHEDYIEFFSDMSPQWFHAQRKAEIQNNVKQQERLTNYVKIKWLYDIQIYLQGFESWRMDELQHQAKILGCKIIDELKNHCLAIVPKPLCEKLMKKHKQWKEIKYLNPNYLQDCIQKKQKLNFRSYYLNL